MHKLLIILLGISIFSCQNAVSKKCKKQTVKDNAIQNIDLECFKEYGRKKQAHKFFSFLHKDRKFNGNILIYTNGELYRECFGWADIPEKTPLSNNSQFQIASMSKPFAAVSIMQLVSAGKLKLTDTINQYLESWPYPGITIDQLLSHTSGIPEYMNLADKYWNDTLGYLNNHDVECLFTETKFPVYFRPGAKHDYCNSNFVLLANIIEKVTGMKYPEYLSKNIFQPLGMQSTFVFTSTDSLMKQEVKGHYGLGHYLKDHFLNGSYGDKNIWSTTGDLLRFYKGIFNPKFLNAKQRNLMFQTIVEKARGTSQYARGWRKKIIDKDTWIFHTGWWKGFRTNLFFHSKKEQCFIVLSNRLKAGTFQSDMVADFFSKGGYRTAYAYYFDSSQIDLKSFDSFRREKENQLRIRRDSN